MTREILPRDTSTFESRDLPKPSEVIGGKYRIEREIGRGGMGVVYEVTHVVMTHSRFAIKWLADRGQDGEEVRRFRREARVSGAIRHANVVEVYDVSLDDHGCYMVMELLQGESLARRMEREGALPYPEACRIMRLAMSGMAAAHALGVIHRDLKPANIFLCEAEPGAPEQPKVLDFGISRVVAAPGVLDTTESRLGTFIGTPFYMAPEQMRAQECDVRTDVYALGVTLYEAISGRHAFRAETEAELVYKVLAGEVAALDDVTPGLPPGLSAIVMRAMALAPDQRFASVEQLSAALAPYEAAHDGLLTSEPPRRKHLGWIAVAMLPCAAALAFGVWLLQARSVPRGSRQETATSAASDTRSALQKPADGASPWRSAHVAADAGQPSSAIQTTQETSQPSVEPPSAAQRSPGVSMHRDSPALGGSRTVKQRATRAPAPSAQSSAGASAPPPPKPLSSDPDAPVPRPKPVVRIDSL